MEEFEGVGMSDGLTKLTLGALPAEASRKWPHREALVFNDRRWTYEAFDAEVNEVAKALINAGVKHGEHVAVWVTNRPEFLFIFFAVIKIGAVIFPLNTRYRVNDLNYALRQSDCVTLITVNRGGPIDFGAMVRDVLGPVHIGTGKNIRSTACPLLNRIIMVDEGDLPGSWSWADFMSGARHVAETELAARLKAVKPGDVAMIMYTSGTTGNPKGVMLNHVGIGMCAQRAALFGMTFADVQLNYLPLFHLFSLGYIVLHSVLTGAKQVLMETFDAAAALGLIEREHVTMLYGYDTHFSDLIAAKKRSPKVGLGTLRTGCFAAGLENSIPIAVETQRQLCRTLSGWGMTETWSGQTLSFLDDDEDKRCMASGYPMPGVEIRIVDPETGDDVPQGQQGEILQRSDCCMLGYYKDAEATAKMVDQDGWLHTGDAGLIRPDGHLRFVGRYKDMLKVGGENVSPAEVELLLTQLPEIAQVAVVGCPDSRLNEVAVAFVVARVGVVVDPEEVINFCRGKLASYKIPRRVILIDQLPMTASGKVQKQKLRDTLKTH
ncbi:AMP-binding protein [Bradyrhizobium sp. PRIMUS42]|uniref:AMP-binding protein n=2 Tax=unclassified Bradyrhizobium TaxID=2631580 RepID=UPI002867F176|nr:AMP-binding protein [Bradyrhizobium sp. PRIMUS42]